MKNYKISHCGLSYLQLANCSIVMNSEILVVCPKKKKKKNSLRLNSVKHLTNFVSVPRQNQ
jgi:hypothetical protein